jgi:hypothetical protein
MLRFRGSELTILRPTISFEDHLLLTFRDCLFNIFATTLYGIRKTISLYSGGLKMCTSVKILRLIFFNYKNMFSHVPSK